MTEIVQSIDPRTGQGSPIDVSATDPDEVRRVCEKAAGLAAGFGALPRLDRAQILRTVADRLDGDREGIVRVADEESALGTPRLEGELTRTCFQFRLFAEVLEEGSYLEATIDHAGDTGMGPRPDIRRMLVPIGPIAVFGASNFPLAFSVPGGDTASALAAGCPVVVKVHDGHPRTSIRCAEAIRLGLVDGGASADLLQLVFGVEAGAQLVADPAIRAVGFTGSSGGGRALLDIVNARPDPIPFFGELSGLNPAVVTQAAAAERGDAVGRELVASLTLGGGQFCTKPGIVLVPESAAGETVISGMGAALADVVSPYLLTAGIRDSYGRGIDRVIASGSASVLARGKDADGGFAVTPTLLRIGASEVAGSVWNEIFGPTGVVITYANREELAGLLDEMPASLTSSVHHGEDDRDAALAIVRHLTPKTGRFVFNGQTTGVAVTWAQHHGGPWPSTNSQHTSVGPTAIRRFLRPLAWQSASSALLPEELMDDFEGIPRRVDGQMHGLTT